MIIAAEIVPSAGIDCCDACSWLNRNYTISRNLKAMQTMAMITVLRCNQIDSLSETIYYIYLEA